MRHITATIATRFALKKWGGPTEEWLKHRFDLFERYTLPSVMNQTHRSFTWYLMSTFSVLPEWALEKLRQYSVLGLDEPNGPRIENVDVPVGSYPHLELIKPGTITQYVVPSHIFQLRLDNDDLLHEGFLNHAMRTLDRQIGKRDSLWLSQPKGYISNGTLFKEFGWHYNSFVSFLAKKKVVTSVYAAVHPQIKPPKYAMVFDNKRLWAHLRHGQNVSKGSTPTTGKDLRSEFGIPLGD